MRRPAALFPIVLALGAMILAPLAGAREEGPREIEKCQTIDKPGSYKLVNNLTFKGGSIESACLTITTSSVTIDLAGFTISGPARGIGIASNNQGLHGIAVRNGSISGITIGVSLFIIDAIVEGLRIDGDNAPAVNIEGEGILANGIVKGNIVTSMFRGMDVTGLVTGNFAILNSGNGISVGAGSNVMGNIARNSQIGLFVNCPSNVTNNTAVFNSTVNLELNGDGCNNTNNAAP
jgi:hypothetical protein